MADLALTHSFESAFCRHWDELSALYQKRRGGSALTDSDASIAKRHALGLISAYKDQLENRINGLPSHLHSLEERYDLADETEQRIESMIGYTQDVLKLDLGLECPKLCGQVLSLN